MAAATDGFVIFDERWFFSDNDCDTNMDIAGAGVLVSYGVSALLTTLLSIYAAIIDIANESPNALLPRSVRKHVCRMLRHIKLGEREYSFRRRLLNSLILLFADQQLFTGIALIVSGYIEVSRGTEWSKEYTQLPTKTRLREAHFHLVIYLSCLSCSATLAAMIALQAFFKSSGKVYAIRMFFLFIFFLLLFYSIISTMAFQFIFDFIDISKLHHINNIGKEMNATEMVEDFRNAQWGFKSAAQGLWFIPLALIALYPVWICFRSLLTTVELQNYSFSADDLWLFVFHSKKPKTRGLGLVHMIVCGNSTIAFALQIFYFILSAVFALAQKFRKDPTGYHCDLSVKSEWGFGQTLALFVLWQLLFSACHVYVDIKERQESSTYEDNPSSRTLLTADEQGIVLRRISSLDVEAGNSAEVLARADCHGSTETQLYTGTGSLTRRRTTADIA